MSAFGGLRRWVVRWVLENVLWDAGKALVVTAGAALLALVLAFLEWIGDRPAPDLWTLVLFGSALLMGVASFLMWRDLRGAKRQPAGAFPASARVFSGEPISLHLRDADLKDTLTTFSKVAGLNVAVDRDVTGTVTVDFEVLPWDECLDNILKINHLSYVVNGNVLRVARTATLMAERALGVGSYAAASRARSSSKSPTSS